MARSGELQPCAISAARLHTAAPPSQRSSALPRGRFEGAPHTVSLVFCHGGRVRGGVERSGGGGRCRDWLRGALATVDRSYGILDCFHHHIADTHVAHHLFSQAHFRRDLSYGNGIGKPLGPCTFRRCTFLYTPYLHVLSTPKPDTTTCDRCFSKLCGCFMPFQD